MSETNDRELVERIVLPMVAERSREPGDAWDQAAAALRRLSKPLSTPKEPKGKGE